MDTLKLPDKFSIIKSIEISEQENDDAHYFYKAIFLLKDNTKLHVMEYYNFQLHKHDYSFHWQKANGTLIRRWDNTAHHRQVKTFPFHLHIGNTITESEEMFIEDVLNFISSSLHHKKKK